MSKRYSVVCGARLLSCVTTFSREVAHYVEPPLHALGREYLPGHVRTHGGTGDETFPNKKTPKESVHVGLVRSQTVCL